MPEPLSLNHIENLLMQMGKDERIGEAKHRYALRRALMNSAATTSAAEPVFAWLSTTGMVFATGVATVAVVIVVRFSDSTGAAEQLASIPEQPAVEDIQLSVRELEPSPFATYADFRPIPAREIFENMQIRLAGVAR